jgi:hypothetical protein
MFNLQGKDTSMPADKLFQSFMVLFTKGIFANLGYLFPTPNFPTMIIPTLVAWFNQAIPYGFLAVLLVYAL